MIPFVYTFIFVVVTILLLVLFLIQSGKLISWDQKHAIESKSVQIFLVLNGKSSKHC